MKSTGITRKIDELGRIVIPMELRRSMNITEKDSIEIFVNGDSIVLKKVVNSCVLCGSEENLVSFEDKKTCRTCINIIKSV
jgi:transcriptional pleiotropic regulator of transition state genes